MAKKTSADVEVKKPASKKAVTPEVFVQFDNSEFEVAPIVSAAKAAFKNVNKRVAIKSCKVYIKPQEKAAYYVINEDFSGKIEL